MLGDEGTAGTVPPDVRELADRRVRARRERDFAEADRLRLAIAEQGWLVRDTPDGGYVLEPQRLATVALLVEGWPDDLRECAAALLTHAPPWVVISGLVVEPDSAESSTGGRDPLDGVRAAADLLRELATAYPGRVEARQLVGKGGWAAARNELLGAETAPAHVIMETSTILTGDVLTPLLHALTRPGVVAAGWRGADPDPDLRGFHDAGPGDVTSLLGYLLAVRTDAARAVGGFGRARYYRNADLEFSLRLGRLGRLVVPPGDLPVRQSRHRGYHDVDPEYRERESRRNYRRVLALLREREHPQRAGPP